MTFSNSKSLVPLQFSSKDYEMRAHKLLSTLKTPEPDRMECRRKDSSTNMFLIYRYGDAKFI